MAREQSSRGAGGYVPCVAVKLRREFAVAVEGRRDSAIAWRNVVDEAGLADEFGSLEVSPLVESVKPGEVDELVARARRMDPEYEGADFGSWVQVRGPVTADADALAKRLRELAAVETAYVMKPGPPPVNAADDPRSANQGYLGAAPNGIDAVYAWTFLPGGDGAGVGFVDMEQGWNLNHEDLASAGITLISGVSSLYPWHGTSVLGEVAMVDNTVGGVGIAPASTGRVVSQWRTSSSYNTVDAILDAVSNMAFGDVLLLEAQEYDPVGGAYFWPVEIVDATFDAIRLATALGIVVVEAGCNGGYDLDPYTNLAGKHIFDRASADFRDSGAIMVGAGSSASPHARLSFSNHGSRIDCYGWGENIDTTTTDNAGTDNTAYTASFGGTSGASPIVTGAAVLVQALAQVSPGYRFSPRELRAILVVNGTASANPAADEIGVMPDLRAIITGNKLNLAPDLYLRDYVGDTGTVPTSGIVSMSPDIILKQAPVASPQTSFGPGSGTENDPTLSDDADTGHDNSLYVRVLNRGGSAAANIAVDLYWSPPATLVTPNMWTPIGTANLPSVPSGSVLTVSNEVVWPSAAIPAPGHYCFVAVAGNAADPRPDPATFATFDQYVAYIENNNNVAWRNFDVVPGPPSGGPPGYYRREFLVVGAFDTSRHFELEVVGRLPEGSKAALQTPAWLADALMDRPMEVDRIEERERGRVRLPLNPHGRQALGRLVLHAKSEARCHLFVQIPKKERENAYEFAIRQMYEGIEVGRLTWHFAAWKPTPRKQIRGLPPDIEKETW